MSSEERIAGLERAYGNLQGENKILNERIATLQSAMIRGALREAAKVAGIRAEAIDDLLNRDKVFEVAPDGVVVTREGVGCTPGISPEQWVREARPRYPHWFSSQSHAGDESFAQNPWSSEHWNITRQGKLMEVDMKQAEAMARAAGVDVMAAHPKK
jgi:hypothetical protein